MAESGCIEITVTKGEPMNLKNLFKKKKKILGNFKIRVSTSCEDPNTTYLTFPDGLRLIINDGKYVGCYMTDVC